jgi:hypothetical protein
MGQHMRPKSRISISNAFFAVSMRFFKDDW